jgi:nitrogen fixation protein FixH
MITSSLPEILDLGTINQGQVVENSFAITNKFNQDIEITRISAGCGCTTPDARLGPVKAGETIMVKFTFNSANKTGRHTKSVTVQFKLGNNPESHYVKKFTVFIKA